MKIRLAAYLTAVHAVGSRPSWSLKAANPLDITEVHPDKKCLSDNIFVRYEAPVARIQTVVPIITHHEVMSSRNRALKTFEVVAAQLMLWESIWAGNIGRNPIVIEYSVWHPGQVFTEMTVVGQAVFIQVVGQGFIGDLLSVYR